MRRLPWADSIAMHLGPAVYTRRVLVNAVAVWLLTRAIYVVLAIRAGFPEPTRIAPESAAPLALLVAAVTWLDLRRRNLTVLLPSLGVPPWLVVVAAATLAIAAESALSLALR